jgi:hypothetical protein
MALRVALNLFQGRLPAEMPDQVGMPGAATRNADAGAATRQRETCQRIRRDAIVGTHRRAVDARRRAVRAHRTLMRPGAERTSGIVVHPSKRWERNALRHRQYACWWGGDGRSLFLQIPSRCSVLTRDTN